MIKKSFFVFSFLLIVFAITVHLRPLRRVHFQTQSQENIFLAQNFLYRPDNAKNFIVGSSLSRRLVSDSSADFCNLSMAGESPFEGLDLLTFKNSLPDTLFIEMNVIYKKRDDLLLSTIESSVSYYSKKQFNFLREQYKPMLAVGAFFNAKITAPLLGAFGRNKHPQDSSVTISRELFSKILLQHQKVYSLVPEKKEMDAQFKLLHSYTDPLEQKGCVIILYEVPMDYSLRDSPLSKIVRQYFSTYYPPAKYHYIPLPADTAYTTNDGMHLDANSSIKYSLYFKNYVRNLKSVSVQ